MSDSPLVSIVVPCYNHAAYVEDCLLSILRQTYPAIELIVFDDGSRDESVAIIEALQKHYDFSFTAQANRGLTPTLNSGLAMARGKYFGVFASDDAMMLDRIEKQVRFLEANPQYAACGGNFIWMSEDGEILNKQKIRPARELNFEDIFCDRKHGIAAPTALVRTDAVRAAGGYNENIGIEDTYLWLKLTHGGEKIAVLNDLLVYYRKHDSNMHSRLRFIHDSMMQIYADYTDHPAYNEVRAKLLLTSFVRAAKSDKVFARELLKDIPFSPNRKLLKGLWHLYFGHSN